MSCVGREFKFPLSGEAIYHRADDASPLSARSSVAGWPTWGNPDPCRGGEMTPSQRTAQGGHGTPKESSGAGKLCESPMALTDRWQACVAQSRDCACHPATKIVEGLYYACPRCGKGDVPVNVNRGEYVCEVCSAEASR